MKTKCCICQENKKKGSILKMDIFVCKKCLKSHDITEDGQPNFAFSRGIGSRIIGVDWTITATSHETGETIELYPDPNRRHVTRQIGDRD